MSRLAALLVTLSLLAAGCAPAPKDASPDDIDRLARQIEALGPGVDPREAARAARIAYTYSLQLREEYNVTDGPIIHNAKVNNGLRERGLCVHWAEDIEKRLDAEGFETLEMHRAIAEGNEFRIDHSTAVISARGDGFEEGIVLDPWRFGGVLYWALTPQDAKYFWEPQMEVLARKARVQAERAQTPAY